LLSIRKPCPPRLKADVGIGSPADQQTRVRPDCGGLQTRFCIYLPRLELPTRLFMTRSDHHFRSRFQIAQLAVSRDEIAPGSGGADDRRRRRAWFLRGRRHLRAWISRRALGRRLRRSSWLDRRVFCWVDCHVLRFAEFRASGFRANCAEPIMSLPRAALVVLSDPPARRAPASCCCGSCGFPSSQASASRRCSP